VGSGMDVPPGNLTSLHCNQSATLMGGFARNSPKIADG
jgi:hypothetical protein